jgi:short-subunit dehydrogenase
MTLPAPSPTSTALVTGASSGIGAAIARELAERGYGVTLVARREERLRELAAELSDRHEVRAEVVAGDIADPAGRDRLAARVDELGLDVEVLVNNAGFGGSGKVAKSDRERLVGMVRLNCEALLDLHAAQARGPTALEVQRVLPLVVRCGSEQRRGGDACSHAKSGTRCGLHRESGDADLRSARGHWSRVRR